MPRPGAVRVVGPLPWLVYPALVAVAVSVVLATPVKLFGLSLPEPVTPLVLAFAWPLIRPSVIAPVLLLLLGLFLDLLWGAPLGLWPTCLLAVFAVVMGVRSLVAGQDTRVLFASYATVTVMAFVLAYLVMTLNTRHPPSLFGLVLQIVPTILLFPLATFMIDRFDDGDLRFR